MARNRLGKQGYLFIIDAFISLSVLVAGFFLVFTFYTMNTNSLQQQILARDVINHLSSSLVEDYLASSYNLTNLTNEGEIKNIKHTIAEEMLLDMKYNYFVRDCNSSDYEVGCQLARIVMEDYNDGQYNIVVDITYNGWTRTYYRNNWTSPEVGNAYFVDNQVLYVNDYEPIDDTTYRAYRVAGPGLLSVAVW